MPDVDEEHVLTEINLAFIAGHETTAHSLSWVIYALCKFPDIQMCSSMVDCLESRANAPRRLRDATVFSVWLGMHSMLLYYCPFLPLDPWTYGPYPGPGGPYP